MPNEAINSIRIAVSQCKGMYVKLLANRGRNKKLLAYGILEGVYPDVFTVVVQNDGYTQRYSYTYSEILTKHVNIKPV